MGCAQSPGQKEITEPSLNFALKRGGTEFKDSYDASERISRQFIATFSKQIFGTYSPDPTKHKMVWRGTAGPRTVNYDNPNTGQIQFRDDCNNIPEFGCMLWRGTAATIPAAYQVAINALQTQDPEYKNAFDNYNTALREQQLQEDAGRNSFTQYLLGQRNIGKEGEYDTWTAYYKAEQPALWSRYQLALQNSNAALRDLQDVQDKFSNNAVLDSIRNFNAWSRETDRGTSGMDSFWGWSPDAAQCILQWKQGNYSGGGSFTVGQSSQIYEKTTASGDVSLLFGFIRIGGTGSGSSVFDSSSNYQIRYEWKASATINATPPGKAYNFPLLTQYRNGPISPSYPGHKPLTGESKSPLPNMITSVVLMYGLSMTATFDETTYKRIEEQSTDVVSFGFFSIGDNQSYTKTTWDSTHFSMTVTPNDEQPFIAAYYTDTLLG